MLPALLLAAVLVLGLVQGQGRQELLASCGSGRFTCHNGRSVPASVRCDWVKDCDQGEDEEHCPMCGCDAFDCGSGDCRRRVDVCDGKADCPNGRDEEGCAGRPAHLFACGDGVVILKEAICDGVPDCHSHADEANCTSCSRDAFLCDGICWRTSRRCDGIPDCQDGEDEQDCTGEAASGAGAGDNGAASWAACASAVGVPLALLVLCSLAAIACFFWRRRRRRQSNGFLEKSYGPSSVTYSRDSPSSGIHINETEFETVYEQITH